MAEDNTPAASGGTEPVALPLLPPDWDKQAVAKIYDTVEQVRIKSSGPAIVASRAIVFGLIGSSLGARPGSRTSRSQGFGISVVLILVYYVLSFSFSSLGVKGTLPPILAAWLPVMLFLGAGGLLLKQASR